MDVSQRLRNRADDTVLYFAALTRTRDNSRLKDIQSNLRYGATGANEHPMHSALDIHIPDDQQMRPSPWDEELVAMTELRYKVLSQTRDLEQMLQSLPTASVPSKDCR